MGSKMKSSAFLKHTSLLAILTFISCLPHAALAQIDQQTGIADPGRASEQMREQMQAPSSAPDIQIKQMELVGAPAGADKITFKLDGLKIEGNSVYKENELSPIYKDSIGETITLADLYRIANQMTLKYRNDGYILTQVVVPPQTIDGGTPRLQIVEGFIDKVTVQADNQGENETALVRNYADQIRSGKALNVRQMERQLLLINDLPGVTARAVISPSAVTPGAADMLIIVSRDPFEGLVSADNLGSRYLGQWSVNGVATANSLFGNNEELTAQAAYAPGTGYELLYGGVSYEQPIGIYGTRVGGLASVTETDPGFDLSQFDVRGHATLFSLYARHPFIRTRNENLAGTLTFDVRDARSSNNVEDTRKDHIRALRAAMKYDFLDTLLGVAVNSVNLEISKGLGIFGASDEGDFTSRPDGDPEFTKAELELQRLQRITNSVNLLLAGRGQLASNALLSSEEFGVGSVASGRGYDPSEITGDEGIAGTAELQWNNPFFTPTGKVLDRIQLYTFTDAGRVWNDDATTADGERESLVSTGLGVRLDFDYDIKTDAGVAFPLTRRQATENDTDPRFYISVSKKF